MWYQILLLSIVCYSGIHIGFLLGFLADDEMKDGKKYFLIFKKLLFIGIFVFYGLITNTLFGVIMGIIGLIFILYYKLIRKLLGIYLTEFIIFSMFTFMLYSAFIFSNNLILISVLIFCYGLPTGSILKFEKINQLKIVLVTLPLAAIPLIFYLIF